MSCSPKCKWTGFHVPYEGVNGRKMMEAQEGNSTFLPNVLHPQCESCWMDEKEFDERFKVTMDEFKKANSHNSYKNNYEDEVTKIDRSLQAADQLLDGIQGDRQKILANCDRVLKETKQWRRD